MEDLKSADDLPRCPDDELKVLPSRKSLNPYSEIVLVMLFIISISLPTARMALPGYSNHWSAAEQATLAPFPKIGPDLATIKAFPHSFKRYFQENFGFRKPLLYWHGVFKYSWLKVSSSPFVILGQGGWLFFADEASMESLRCSKPFTNEQLAQWKRTLELRNEVLSKDGMKYLVVVVPDKHTIYPEYVPSAYARINEKSRREQLIEYLEANSRLAIIDLTEPLKKAKTANEIYFRTDTHWNDLGAFVAYQEIGRQIGNWYPQIQLRSRSEFNLAHAVSKSGDLARMLGLEDLLTDKLPQLVSQVPRNPHVTSFGSLHGYITQCQEAELSTAVILRDSFGNALIPFLSEHFRRAIYLWANVYAFPQDIIQRERPQVVIHEFVERLLAGATPP